VKVLGSPTHRSLLCQWRCSTRTSRGERGGWEGTDMSDLVLGQTLFNGCLVGVGRIGRRCLEVDGQSILYDILLVFDGCSYLDDGFLLPGH